MTIPVTREAISYGGNDGALLTGAARQIISGVGATRLLLAKESGALCLFDRAAGVVYTLPIVTADNLGMRFEFATTVTITSNSAKVITGSASQFLVGGVLQYIAGAATTSGVAFNGTTHIASLSNGTTTGGVIGDRFWVEAISTTQWAIQGLQSGSGTLATSASTT
jgi:hypothetical protein